MRKFSGMLASAALLASVLVVAPAANAQETITSNGSSYMNSFQQTCSAIYTSHKVTYGSGGSSAGKSSFKAGTTDFGGTDDAYAEGTAPSNFVYVPLVGGPIAITFNVPGVKSLRLTPKLVSDIYNGTVKTWDAAPIKKLNPTAKLPKENIQIVYRSDGSGTTANFGNFMKQVVGGSWTANNAFNTTLGKTPIGIGASGNTGVASTVASTKFSIAYMDLADAKKNTLSAAAIQNNDGEFIVPTPANSGRFIAAQKIGAEGLVEWDYTKKVRGAYTLSLIAYGLAPTASSKPVKAAAVKDYFTFLVRTCGPQVAAANSFAPVQGALQRSALVQIAKIK